MLRVKKLVEDAILPTVGHAGEDLGYDLYANEDVNIRHGSSVLISTGIAAVWEPIGSTSRYGLLIRDRSSMAGKGLIVMGGVIDSGYRGEIKVRLGLPHKSTVLNTFVDVIGCQTEEVSYLFSVKIKKGDKIAQMIPMEVHTGSGVIEVDELPASSRGTDGFGSTGV